MNKAAAILSKEAWTFIGLTFLSVCVLFSFVNLKPQVDYNTFFSSDDPTYKSDLEISKLFPRNDGQLLIGVIGDIHSKAYQQKLKHFGNFLRDMEHIDDVLSIVDGPRSVRRAESGPLWKRMLIADEGRSSNVVVAINPNASIDKLPQIIEKIEKLKSIFDNPNFQIKLSGFPYIVELMRRNLDRDLKLFTSLAFIIFGLVVLLIFHSWRILLGMLITCFNAACLTLVINHFFDIPIGILTANLTTIIFVLTLSHIVFLTFNWKHNLDLNDSHECTKEAIRVTAPASFWAMITTLLGFFSLLYVSAKPIRDLGVSGMIGTVVAFIMAYSIFPIFLRLQKPDLNQSDIKLQSIYHFFFKIFNKLQWLIVIAIFGIIMFTLPFLRTLNTDPSLISFFAPKSQITQGLKYIDEQGGSNPLLIVVKDSQNIPFHKKKNVERLWDLHNQIEQNKNVGNALSLPLLIKEARGSSIFSMFLSNKRILKIMDHPKYGNATSSFMTKDYQSSLLLLRMKEDGRKKHRLDIIDDLNKTIEHHGFVPHLLGGVYALQGHLSKLVSSSLIFGLTRLITIFAIIAFVASLSLRTSLAMTISICLIPLCILGPIGLFKLPLDIITAPAANIAISMGIDAMIHMTHFHRRLRKEDPFGENHWLTVREKMWEPVMTSMLIVSCGFGIFFFSSFPPTQRFGGSIVWGTLIAAMTALFIFTMLTGNGKPKKSKHRFKHIKSAMPDPSNLENQNWN